LDIPIKPLADKVVVQIIKQNQDEKSPGGIVLPGTMKSKYKLAKVVAVSDGYYQYGQLVKPLVEPGQTVHVAAGVGDEVRIGEEEFLITPERALNAIMRDTKDVAIQQ
jgi:chaperonin GroES